MTKFEATMVEFERVYAECAMSQVQFMDLIMANVQILTYAIQELERRDGSNGHFLSSTYI